MPHPALISRFRRGFPFGLTRVLREDGAGPTKLDFSIVRLRAGETRAAGNYRKERAWLLLSGELTFELGHDERLRARRRSLFEEGPSCLHAGPGTLVRLAADTDAELALFETSNERLMEPRLFTPRDVKPEYRGKGLVQDAALRNVRLIFDWNNRPDSNLVLGEVVNFPGRWSSYPPHHHPQPEIYHYRFTKPQGYGHGELDDEVLQVRPYDTVKILDGVGHSQAAAPGYGMYYIWAIRHLPRKPYRGFRFGEDHRWTLDRKQQGWVPAHCP